MKERARVKSKIKRKKMNEKKNNQYTTERAANG